MSRFVHRLGCPTFGVFLAVAGALAQPVVSVLPATPQRGTVVTFIYDPAAPGAALAAAEQVWLVPEPGPRFSPHLGAEPVAMTADQGRWVLAATVDAEATRFSFSFRAGPDADAPADRGEGGYDVLVHDAAGRPLRGLYTARAATWPQRLADPAAVRARQAADYRQELALYPDHFPAQVYLLALDLQAPGVARDSVLAAAEAAIADLRQREPNDARFYEQVLWAYHTLGEDAKADAVEAQAIAADPTGDLARADLLQQALQTTAPDLRQGRLEEILRRFPDGSTDDPGNGAVWRELLELYAEARDEAKTLEAARRYVAGEAVRKATARERAARVLAERGFDLDQALAYAQDALAHVDAEPFGPARYALLDGEEERLAAEAEAERRHLEAHLTRTLGFVLMKRGQEDEAEEALVKAKWLAPEDERTLRDLATLYEQQDRYGEAYDLYYSLLLDRPTDADVRAGLRRSYAAVHGSLSGFDEATTKLQRLWREVRMPELRKERLDQDAPPFAFAYLDGTPATTADFAGKVLVLDFWATWCGPCLAAFPHLQRVYERYRDDPRVAFLVVNTGWQNTLEEARTWAAEHAATYTFPIAYDDDRTYTTFGVRGIPTTLVLDGEGRVQFRRIGFSGPDLEADLALQIELLLE